MVIHKAKSALKILREDGPAELTYRSKNYFLPSRSNFIINNYKNKLIGEIKFYAAADPYKIIKIKPNKIQYGVNKNLLARNTHSKLKADGLGQIKDGSWDIPENRRKIEDFLNISGMIERFAEGKKWKETKYYTQQIEMLGSREIHKKRGFDTVEEYLTSRCESYDSLYESIKCNGYLQNHAEECRVPSKSQPIKDQLEVLVSIGREGDILFYEGNHRFGIAKALDIKEIPVQVVCRHKQWQELRDEIHNNGLPEGREDLRDHPDLQDVLN